MWTKAGYNYLNKYLPGHHEYLAALLKTTATLTLICRKHKPLGSVSRSSCSFFLHFQVEIQQEMHYSLDDSLVVFHPKDDSQQPDGPGVVM